jgi:exodeoxyribonuclease VII large subunit
MISKTITVSELNKHIKDIIEGDITLKNVYVNGEISNFKLHSSGHMYFTLKDEYSKIKCIMFKNSNTYLKFIPEEGMKVIVKGNISIYERDGQYQLYCNKMEPDGIGSLYLAYEQLKSRLEREGLFDKEKKKSLPFYPEKIGVATSSTGSVIRDIINVSINRFKHVNIVLFPVKVQGEGAADSIISAIEYFNSRRDIDIIIIGRGGGSIEELWAFNEESLARSIAKSNIPIVSAVGHETDFTISDFVCDIRASTPSHAAEICVPSYNDLKYRINVNIDNLEMEIKSTIINSRHIIQGKSSIIERYSPINLVKQKLQYIDYLQNKIITLMKNGISTNRNKFIMHLNRIDDLSPVKVLTRGYGYIESEGMVISNIKGLRINQKVRLHMHDGYADCNINNIMEGELWALRKKI